LAKTLRGPVGSFLLFAAMASISSCSSKKTASVSSEQFLAPQNQQVELLVSRLEINRVVHPGVLDSILEPINPVLNIVGKLNKDLLLIYNGENNSRDLITINFDDNAIEKVMTKDQFLEIFNQQAQKPNIGTVTQLLNGWLLGFETTSNSIFAIREFPEGSGEIVANLVLDQATIQDEVFPDEGGGGPPVTKAVVKAQSLVEFQPNEVLLIPATTNITSLHHLRLEEVQVEDEFGVSHPELNGHFILLPPPGLPPDTQLREGFLEFDKVRVKTGNTAVNFIDFPPIALPNTNRVLLFDGSTATSSFITLIYRLELLDPEDPSSDLVYRASVEILADKTDLTDAISAANSGGEPFSGTLKFQAPFLHPGGSLPTTDPNYRTQVLSFEGETNNVFAIDWTAPEGSGRVRVFSSANQLSSRTDLHPDPISQPGTFDPNLLFARNDVLRNRIAWDQGPGDLLSLSYETGQWVVVLHKSDISQQTDSGLVTLNYIEAVDNDNLRVVDLESSTVLGIRLSYQSIPVSFPR
jgi:hypothetical protein